MTNLERMMWRLREKKIDFGQYVARTRSEYRAMAAYLLRRWASPEWFSQEDMEQELYIASWRHIWGYKSADGNFVDFDPTRGVSLSRWVIFGAMGVAKRSLHKARGVTISGSPDRKASVFETPASAFGEDAASFLESLLAEAPTAEAEMSRVQETRRKATEALRVCENGNERTAVLAIREAGSLDGAWRVLYDDVNYRTELRLGCEDKAERFVQWHAAKVARRIRDGVIDVNPG